MDLEEARKIFDALLLLIQARQLIVEVRQAEKDEYLDSAIYHLREATNNLHRYILKNI